MNDDAVMTVRDRFAAAALAALIAKMPLFDRQGEHGIAVQETSPIYREIADSSYWYADAMMLERERDRS